MRYYLRKLAFYLVALWAAVTLNFFIPRMMPGDPVDILMAKLQQRGGGVDPSARRAYELLLGTDSDEPLIRQYFSYLGNMVRGDFGISVSDFPTPVSTVIATSLPWTVVLVGIATVLAVLVAVLGSALGWFPLIGGYDVVLTPGWNAQFVGSALYHGVLPALTIVISSVGGWLLGTRNMMVSTMAEDFVLTAEAKGLRQRRIMVWYAARNAVLPSVAGFAISLGFIVAGSIVTEQVFAYPGIGSKLLQAVQNNDYALMQAIFLVITVAVLAANLVVDLLYGIIDPRTRTSG
jgi:peptide/nickel transport system permease protein